MQKRRRVYTLHIHPFYQYAENDWPTVIHHYSDKGFSTPEAYLRPCLLCMIKLFTKKAIESAHNSFLCILRVQQKVMPQISFHLFDVFD